MPNVQINPTRMELARIKRKLASARRGHKLLKDKRDELVRRFLGIAQRTRELRKTVENGLKSANVLFGTARAVMGEGSVENALSVPVGSMEVKCEIKNVMGVAIPQYSEQSKSGDTYPYGFYETTAELDCGIAELKRIMADMIHLAELEKACRLMADEIEKTRRRVNALEYVIIPDCTEKLKYIAMKLEENERGTQIRLIKVKDLMLGNAHRG